ncbi:MAG: hypothetical protein HUU01_01970 [Saprospiraceae bacterium]|nr:hypothetical protein [Saprospiraceae bacterium]
MKKIAFLILIGFWAKNTAAQRRLEVGMEATVGRAHTTFKGDLATMVGFETLEITRADVDTAFARFDLEAPRWLKDLFPGISIEVDQEVMKKLSRPIHSVRFFARYDWLGASICIADPRLAEQPESKKTSNQLKSLRLSLSGDADALAAHLAEMALADETRTKSFFAKRYDLEAYVDVKRLFLRDQVLAEWGDKGNNTIDAEVLTGFRFSADPSPVVDLGSILFVREKIDELMEGGLLNPVENTTDRIADGIQEVVFGKFRDPRVVPSLGWFLRGTVPVTFGNKFSVVAGGEVSIHEHTSIKGTKPMFSVYGFAGVRWGIW